MTKLDGILGGIPPLLPLPGEVERALVPPNSPGPPPVGQPDSPQNEQWQPQLPQAGVWDREGEAGPAPKQPTAPPPGPGIDQAYSLDLGHTDDELAAFLEHTYDVTGKRPRSVPLSPGRFSDLPAGSGPNETDRYRTPADIRFLLTGTRGQPPPEWEELQPPPSEGLRPKTGEDTISREELLQIAVRAHRLYHAREGLAGRPLPGMDYITYAAEQGMLAHPVLDAPREAATRGWAAHLLALAIPVYELVPLALAPLPASLEGCPSHDSLLRLFQAGVWSVPAQCRPGWPGEPISRREVASVMGRILTPSDRIFPRAGGQEAGLGQK